MQNRILISERSYRWESKLANQKHLIILIASHVDDAGYDQAKTGRSGRNHALIRLNSSLLRLFMRDTFLTRILYTMIIIKYESLQIKIYNLDLLSV